MTKVSELPIGVFDSGLGGLSVLRKLLQLLPAENFLYFGDTARVPYGNKSPKIIMNYCREIVNFFIKKKVKAIIIACNTATIFALDDLKNDLKVPIFGVVEPTVRALLKSNDESDTCILATRSTVASKIFPDLAQKFGFKGKLHQKSCPLFVPLVEEGAFGKPWTKMIIKYYLHDLVMSGVHKFILACTHYPLLIDDILEVFPKLNLIDSSNISSKFIEKKLTQLDLLNLNFDHKASLKIFLSSITEFHKNLDIFLSPNYEYEINEIKLPE